MNNRRKRTSLEKYIPLTLFVRVQKGYWGFACERESETEHNWNISTPTFMAVNVVSFLFSWCWDPSCWVMAFFTAFYQHLLWTPTHQGSKPLWPGMAFPTISRLELSGTQLNSLLFNSSALYYLQTPSRRYGHASTPPQFLPISGDRDVSLPLSLEWPVWSTSSGNNCHAVHRSLSSGASVYECTIGIFFSSSHFISQFPPTRFPLITAIGMYHFFPVHHLGMAFLAMSKGQNTTLAIAAEKDGFWPFRLISVKRNSNCFV